MKLSKISDDINPWTSRLKQTFFEGTTPPTSKHPTLKQNNHTKESNNLSPNNGYLRKRISTIPTISDQLDLLHVYHTRIPSRSEQNIVEPNIYKMPIRHKFIRFELRTKSDEQKRKEKHLPFTPNNLKQYIQEMPINSRNILNQQLDCTKYQKILNVKRYFTEEKDYKFYESKQFRKKSERKQQLNTNKSTQLAPVNQSEQVRKKIVIGVKMSKIARNKKQMLSPEDIAKHQKLYQQIRNICDSNNHSIKGHLSLMKRNYNLQKLQRLLKNQQHLQIRVHHD